MDYLSDDLLGNIEEMVMHLSKRCELFAQAKPYFSQTEVGATMNNILISIRRLEYIIKLICERQKRTLLNVIDFKINKVQIALGHISSDLKSALKNEIRNKAGENYENWEKWIKSENESPIFTLRDEEEDCKNARYFLMSRVKENYLEAQKRIEQIDELLGNLKTLLQKIDSDEKLQRELYNTMLDDYRTNEWPSEFEEFIGQINRVVRKKKNILAILEDQLEKLVTIYLGYSKSPAVKNLYNTVIAPRRMPFEIIKTKRKTLTKEDISDYFNFLHKYRTLKDHIDSIPLLEPVEGQYGKLFANCAAKEYVERLSPFLLMYGGIQEKGHFPILLMALRDLGLSPIENKNKPFVQMKNYVNEITNDNEIRFDKGHTIFSKMFGWLGEGKSFCELEYGDITDTNFTEDNIKEYQDVYWRCFTILNQRGLRMPNEINVATYLQNQHPNVNLSVVMGELSAEHLIRINFLRSTLRKETLVFG